MGDLAAHARAIREEPPPSEAARLSDEHLGVPCAHVTRLGPRLQQGHDTASIMAMTSAGW